MTHYDSVGIEASVSIAGIQASFLWCSSFIYLFAQYAEMNSKICNVPDVQLHQYHIYSEVTRWFNYIPKRVATLPCNMSLIACFLTLSTNAQGGVSTYARCGGIFDNRFTANLQANQPVKGFWKSVKIWHPRYQLEYGVSILWNTVKYSKVYGYSSSQFNLPHRYGNSHAIGL